MHIGYGQEKRVAFVALPFDVSVCLVYLNSVKVPCLEAVLPLPYSIVKNMLYTSDGSGLPP